MGQNKIDVTSTVIEKSIDTVKGFLEKLLGSTIEEAGLIFAENMRLRRFKNQIKIWDKAQTIAKERGIEPQQIALKALVPLLEYSSLEEEETLQAKWSNLIANYVDSNSKYKSTIFPWILNQLSSEDCAVLDSLENRSISGFKLKSMEVDPFNLIRLGLLEKIHQTPRSSFEKSVYNMQGGVFKLTSLGYIFLQSCSENPKDE